MLAVFLSLSWLLYVGHSQCTESSNWDEYTADTQAFACVFQHVTGQSNIGSTGRWFDSCDICDPSNTWNGVTCESGRPVQLKLTFKFLDGDLVHSGCPSFPDSLRVLEVRNSVDTDGDFLRDLGGEFNFALLPDTMVEIQLEINALTGLVDLSPLGTWHSLQKLFLYGNNFYGPITWPSTNDWGDPIVGIEIEIGENNFFGTVDWAGISKYVTKLDISNNLFEGTPEWSVLSSWLYLEELRLDFNGFTGAIDLTPFGENCTAIQLDYNDFDGVLDLSLGFPMHLQRLDVRNNSLVSTVNFHPLKDMLLENDLNLLQVLAQSNDFSDVIFDMERGDDLTIEIHLEKQIYCNHDYYCTDIEDTGLRYIAESEATCQDDKCDITCRCPDAVEGIFVDNVVDIGIEYDNDTTIIIDIDVGIDDIYDDGDDNSGAVEAAYCNATGDSSVLDLNISCDETSSIEQVLVRFNREETDITARRRLYDRDLRAGRNSGSRRLDEVKRGKDANAGQRRLLRQYNDTQSNITYLSFRIVDRLLCAYTNLEALYAAIEGWQILLGDEQMYADFLDRFEAALVYYGKNPDISTLTQDFAVFEKLPGNDLVNVTDVVLPTTTAQPTDPPDTTAPTTDTTEEPAETTDFETTESEEPGGDSSGDLVKLGWTVHIALGLAALQWMT